MLRYMLLVMVMLAVVSPVRAQNWAESLFDELSVDFGSVPRGQMLIHSFRVVNNTKTPIRIASVRAPMSALSARAAQTFLQPGEETAIIAQMDTNRFINTKTVTIFVTFDQPLFEKVQEVRLWVQANSREDLIFAHDSLDFKKIKRGTTASTQMAVGFLGKPEILVMEATYASNFIQPKLQELRRNKDEVVYQVSATVQGNIPEGKWHTNIWLKTNDKAMPRVRVPVVVEGEPPLLHVKISGPKEALVDQPVTFNVEVQNKGTKATDKELSLMVQVGKGTKPLYPSVIQTGSPLGMDVIFDCPVKCDRPNIDNGLHRDPAEIQIWQQSNHVPVGSIKPGETSKRTFTLTPKQARTMQMAVFAGVWNPGSSKDSALNADSNFATASVQVHYNPKTPLNVLLPPPSQNARRLEGLPKTLAEVPEVFFLEPLTKKMNPQANELHIARTIDRINFLNGKKIDSFVTALLGNRSDLAGLPFVMGDDCRMKEDDSRHFAAALDGVRKAQPTPPTPLLPLPSPPKSRDEPDLTELPHSVWIKTYQDSPAQSELPATARVAALMQVLGPESAGDRHGLAKYLDGESHIAATRALAKLAIFSAEPQIRTEAINALKKRRDKDYSDILQAGLNYPWPAVAQHSSEAIVQLGRTDLIPQLIDVLAQPDPRAPQVREAAGKKVAVVREVVRLNHLHNCLLCHAPATSDPRMTPQDKEHFSKLTAQVALPNESLTAYYRPSNPDILVRLDVTYLRQDFSMNLPVSDAAPWPEMQRYDYLVRTREVSDKEADTLKQLLQPKAPAVLSPYQLAAHSALRELTGLNVQPTAPAWTTALRK